MSNQTQAFFVKKQFHGKPVTVYNKATKEQNSITLSATANDREIQDYVKYGVSISHFGRNTEVEARVSLESIAKRTMTMNSKLVNSKRKKTELVAMDGFTPRKGEVQIVEKVVEKEVRRKEDTDKINRLQLILKMGSKNQAAAEKIFEKEASKYIKKELDLLSSVYGKELTKEEAFNLIHSVD